MKIRWYDRLLLVITSLFLLCFAVCVGLLAVGYGADTFNQLMALLFSSWFYRVALCVVAVLLLAMGLRLMFMRTRGVQTPTSVFMQSTDAGSIRITIAALEAIIQRASRGNAQVRDVKARVIPLENQQMNVALRVMLSADANTKEVSMALQTAVKAALEDNTGIPVPEVEVTVEAAPAPALPARVD